MNRFELVQDIITEMSRRNKYKITIGLTTEESQVESAFQGRHVYLYSPQQVASWSTTVEENGHCYNVSRDLAPDHTAIKKVNHIVIASVPNKCMNMVSQVDLLYEEYEDAVKHLVKEIVWSYFKSFNRCQAKYINWLYAKNDLQVNNPIKDIERKIATLSAEKNELQSKMRYTLNTLEMEHMNLASAHQQAVHSKDINKIMIRNMCSNSRKHYDMMWMHRGWINAVTKPVILKDEHYVRRELGTFLVKINMESFDINVTQYNGPDFGHDYIHPFVSTEGTPCFGNLAQIINRLTSQNDVAGLLIFVAKLLNSYNPEQGPHRRLYKMFYDSAEEEEGMHGSCYNEGENDCRECEDEDCPHWNERYENCNSDNDRTTEECMDCNYSECLYHDEAFRDCYEAKSCEADCVECQRDECSYKEEASERCFEEDTYNHCFGCDIECDKQETAFDACHDDTDSSDCIACSQEACQHYHDKYDRCHNDDGDCAECDVTDDCPHYEPSPGRSGGMAVETEI